MEMPMPIPIVKTDMPQPTKIKKANKTGDILNQDTVKMELKSSSKKNL
jgi:hypothetical protein